MKVRELIEMLQKVDGNLEVMTSDPQIVGLTPTFAVHVSKARRIRTPDTVKPHYTYLESDEGRSKIVQIF